MRFYMADRVVNVTLYVSSSFSYFIFWLALTNHLP